ncbi:MAG: Maf family protein [Phycisphaeraceae bacterium]|nr:Maf family protein [Phycisphaeraceae bacterium]
MPKVYLASRSPRRRRLLAEHGIDHDVIAAIIDDGGLESGAVAPEHWVKALAYLKAAVAREAMTCGDAVPGAAVVLGADTVVVKGTRLIGQARNSEHALEIIRSLENGEHRVVTGVAMIDLATGAREMYSDQSTVRVGEIGGERIGAYVASGQWLGKAGAYNLYERIEDGWPIDFVGDPTTIMGLPMESLPGRLERFSQRVAAGRAGDRWGLTRV